MNGRILPSVGLHRLLNLCVIGGQHIGRRLLEFGTLLAAAFSRRMTWAPKFAPFRREPGTISRSSKTSLSNIRFRSAASPRKSRNIEKVGSVAAESQRKNASPTVPGSDETSQIVL